MAKVMVREVIRLVYLLERDEITFSGDGDGDEDEDGRSILFLSFEKKSKVSLSNYGTFLRIV